MRVRPTLVAVLAVAGLATGCTSSGTLPPAPTSAAAGPSASSAAPSPTAAAVPFAGTRIPDASPARLLQLADGGYNALGSHLQQDWLAFVVRPPCATSAAASDAALAARAAVEMSFNFTNPTTYDGDVIEVITKYKTVAAAQDYVAAVKAAVAACPTEKVSDSSTRTRSITDNGFAGDDSVMISTIARIQSTQPMTNGDHLYYVAVIRIGDAVMIVQVNGWEGSPANKAYTDRLIQSALVRATA